MKHKLHTAAIALAIILTGMFTGCAKPEARPTLADRIAEETDDRPAYWHVDYVTDGEARIVCDNKADATVIPGDQFGSLTVSCGTK